MDEEPLYVNAKQYYRILKRRVARARLDEVHKLAKQRKVRPTPIVRNSSTDRLFPPVRIQTCCSHICTNRATNMLCGDPGAPVDAS